MHTLNTMRFTSLSGQHIFDKLYAGHALAQDAVKLDLLEKLHLSFQSVPGYKPPRFTDEYTPSQALGEMLWYLNHLLTKVKVSGCSDWELACDDEGQLTCSVTHGEVHTYNWSMSVFYIPWLEQHASGIFTIWIEAIHFLAEATGCIDLSELCNTYYSYLEESGSPENMYSESDEETKQIIDYTQQWQWHLDFYGKKGPLQRYLKRMDKAQYELWQQDYKKYQPKHRWENDILHMCHLVEQIYNNGESLDEYCETHGEESDEYDYEMDYVQPEQQFQILWCDDGDIDLITRQVIECLDSSAQGFGVRDTLKRIEVELGQPVKLTNFHLPTALMHLFKLNNDFANKYFTYKGMGVVQSKIPKPKPRKLIDIL